MNMISDTCWCVTPCNLDHSYQRSGETLCLMEEGTTRFLRNSTTLYHPTRRHTPDDRTLC